ncbi:MAG: DUF4837 family protein [bacterium]|uniref:DUF4837 family protein n=2 Tax=Bacteria candidate phyla TaxID=1783234 RepID=A0A124G0Q6_UNCT6|nr:MAG: hypothetical protein XD76_0793 [candidate division TA06 bacterium 32_111]KUK88255.1 MAG: hypothetical protein XE03_0261 [candidate division TA06 bacterium 34_109]MDI6701060.1 DUF4837 family protein [bacterium]HAF07188.1 hypothetical protein [candidate division WOR-3 bacterium]HCP16039.1 hypothetical protein [candidate division WOR-3 bacterium]
MKRSIKITFLIFLSILSFLIGSCERKKRIKDFAIGKVEEIVIAANETVYANVEKELLDALYIQMDLPVKESVFYTIYSPLEKLHIHKRNKNIVFVTNINRNDEYSKIINEFLNSEDIELIKKEKVAFFKVFDGFVEGQNILIIAGTDEESIKESIKKNKEKIQQFFLENSYRSVEMMVYFTGENNRVSSLINKRLGIKIKVPSDFETSFYDKNLNCYAIVGRYPDRFITILKNPDMKNFNYDFMIKTRNRIGKEKYYGDFVDTSFVPLKREEVDFKGYKALYIMGVYSNDKENLGGPFFTYLVNTGKELVYIDGHIFYPGERKYFKLMELKAIVNSMEF